MAVMLQRVVGAARGAALLSRLRRRGALAQLYPPPPMSAADGIVAVALGLGRTVVEGGACLRFCPRYPQHLLQFSSAKDALDASQREFWALPLAGEGAAEAMRETSFGLEVAEADGDAGGRGLDLVPRERRPLRRPVAARACGW